MSTIMAVAVEPSHLSPPFKEKNYTIMFELQTAEIVHQIFHTLLFDNGVRINGFKNGMREQKFSTDEMRRAFLSLKGACKQFMKLNSREINEKTNQIIVSDTMMCAFFHKTMYSIFEDDINWGRIVALFCFSVAFAMKAYEDNKLKTIDSIEGWMTTFINDNLKDWILKHHGWGGLPDKFNDDKVSGDIHKSSNNGGTWLTLAAVGIGAVALTAIFSR